MRAVKKITEGIFRWRAQGEEPGNEARRLLSQEFYIGVAMAVLRAATRLGIWQSQPLRSEVDMLRPIAFVSSAQHSRPTTQSPSHYIHLQLPAYEPR